MSENENLKFMCGAHTREKYPRKYCFPNIRKHTHRNNENFEVAGNADMKRNDGTEHWCEESKKAFSTTAINV